MKASEQKASADETLMGSGLEHVKELKRKLADGSREIPSHEWVITVTINTSQSSRRGLLIKIMLSRCVWTPSPSISCELRWLQKRMRPYYGIYPSYTRWSMISNLVLSKCDSLQFLQFSINMVQIMLTISKRVDGCKCAWVLHWASDGYKMATAA